MKQGYWRSLSGCKESTTSLTSEHFMNYSYFYKIIVLTSKKKVRYVRCGAIFGAPEGLRFYRRLRTNKLFLQLPNTPLSGFE